MFDLVLDGFAWTIGVLSFEIEKKTFLLKYNSCASRLSHNVRYLEQPIKSIRIWWISKRSMLGNINHCLAESIVSFYSITIFSAVLTSRYSATFDSTNTFNSTRTSAPILLLIPDDSTYSYKLL